VPGIEDTAPASRRKRVQLLQHRSLAAAIEPLHYVYAHLYGGGCICVDAALTARGKEMSEKHALPVFLAFAACAAAPVPALAQP